METLSLAISLLFVVVFGYFLLRMVWSIGTNLAHGRRLRRQLRGQLMGMPLERVLEHAGADPDLYLHERQMHEINRELRNCANCTALQECQVALDANVPIEKFEFCPNYEALFKR
jgi:hypothetical protein